MKKTCFEVELLGLWSVTYGHKNIFLLYLPNPGMTDWGTARPRSAGHGVKVVHRRRRTALTRITCMFLCACACL